MRLGVELKRTRGKRLPVQAARIVPRRFVIWLVEAMARRYPGRRASRWICGGGPYGYARQSFPAAWFGIGTELAFEDMTAVAPACWDEYLTHLYGDYRTPPPPSRQLSHHDVTAVQLSRGLPPADLDR